MSYRAERMPQDATSLKQDIGGATHDHAPQREVANTRPAGKAEQMIALLADRARSNDRRR